MSDAGAIGLDPAISRQRTTSPTPKHAKLRPLSYWAKHSPPGWISRHAASHAEPVALAQEIHGLALDFLDWLQLPSADRWDTFKLQALSAALFNRFRREHCGSIKQSNDLVDLLDLAWPPQSEAIQHVLSEMRVLLQPPLAVFKAVRLATTARMCPTESELRFASDAIEASRDDLERLVFTLGNELRNFAGRRETATDAHQWVPGIAAVELPTAVPAALHDACHGDFRIVE